MRLPAPFVRYFKFAVTPAAELEATVVHFPGEEAWMGYPRDERDDHPLALPDDVTIRELLWMLIPLHVTVFGGEADIREDR
jgi:hypothetical protein